MKVNLLFVRKEMLSYFLKLFFVNVILRNGLVEEWLVRCFVYLVVACRDFEDCFL